MRGGLLHVAQRDPGIKLVESNVLTTPNTSAGAGRLEATPGLVITGMDLPGRGAGPVRSLHRPAAATRAGHVRGMAARRRAAWLTGELTAAGTSVSEAGMHQVQRKRLVARSGA